MRCIILPSARDDLIKIGDYIARDNPARAISYVDEIEKLCMQLARMPGMGTKKPELADNLRSMTFESYVIFYSVQSDEIHIEHVIHGARDIERFFRL